MKDEGRIRTFILHPSAFILSPQCPVICTLAARRLNWVSDHTDPRMMCWPFLRSVRLCPLPDTVVAGLRMVWSGVWLPWFKRNDVEGTRLLTNPGMYVTI